MLASSLGRVASSFWRTCANGRPDETLMCSTAMVRDVTEDRGVFQRDLVDKILGGINGTPIEGGYAPGERVDECVQLGVWKCPVDVSVSFRRVAIEVVYPALVGER
jgi:hypothetical protein